MGGGGGGGGVVLLFYSLGGGGGKLPPPWINACMPDVLVVSHTQSVKLQWELLGGILPSVSSASLLSSSILCPSEWIAKIQQTKKLIQKLM